MVVPLAFLIVLTGCLSLITGSCFLFFASLFNHANLALVSADGREVDVDARTSDAIAMAVKTGAPLYVHEDVLDEAARDVG